MDVMTHEQMWKRYKTLMKDKPSDYKIRCHLCNEVIGEGDPDIEYSKNKKRIRIVLSWCLCCTLG